MPCQGLGSLQQPRGAGGVHPTGGCCEGGRRESAVRKVKRTPPSPQKVSKSSGPLTYLRFSATLGSSSLRSTSPPFSRSESASIALRSFIDIKQSSTKDKHCGETTTIHNDTMLYVDNISETPLKGHPDGRPPCL